jgi:5-methylcytosine-specific restriction protein B
MDELCNQAKQLTDDIKAKRSPPKVLKNTSIKADEIRQFVLKNYILPARKRGAKTVTVKAGEVHDQMGFINRLPNVCQALGKEKFQKLANIGKPVRKGPQQGSTTCFIYKL